MSFMEQCTDSQVRGGLPGELDRVRGHVSDAVLALRRARVGSWVSDASAGYHQILDDQIALVRRLGPLIDAADSSVRAAQTARDQAGLPW
ncbi:MAG: hypothetical protein GX593_00855 [Actinomycetales bacterium]|nr:hypothetical protein [Actinomycetales bacterium]